MIIDSNYIFPLFILFPLALYIFARQDFDVSKRIFYNSRIFFITVLLVMMSPLGFVSGVLPQAEAVENEIRQLIKIQSSYPADVAFADFPFSPPLLNIDKTIIFYTVSHTGENDHSDTFKSVELIDEMTIRLKGEDTATGNNPIDFVVYIVEYMPEAVIDVQHLQGTIAASGTGTEEFLMGSVNTTSSMIVSRGHHHNASETTVGDEEFTRVRILNSTAWEYFVATAPNTGPQGTAVSIVDWNQTDIRVVRDIGTLIEQGGTQGVTITPPGSPVDPTRTILMVTYSNDQSDEIDEDDAAIKAALISNGDINFARGDAEGNIEYAYELIEFPADFVKVTHFNSTLDAAVLSLDVAVPTIKDYDKAIAISTVGSPFSFSTGMHDNIGEVPGGIDRVQTTFFVSDNENVNISREDSTGELQTSWQLIEFLEPVFPENAHGTNFLEKVVKIEGIFPLGDTFKDFTITPALVNVNKTMIFMTMNSTFGSGSSENGKMWGILNETTFRIIGSSDAVNDEAQFNAVFVEMNGTSPIFIQHDQLQFTGGTTDAQKNMTISPVNTTTTFIIGQGSVMEDSDPTFGMEEFALVTLENETTWKYEPQVAQDATATAYRAEIVDFNDNDVLVQRGTLTLTGTSTTFAPPIAVDREQTLLFVNFRTIAGSFGETPDRSSLLATIDLANDISISRVSSAISLEVAWQTISFLGDQARIQHGTHHQDPGQSNSTEFIPPFGSSVINASKAFAIGTVGGYYTQSMGSCSSTVSNNYDCAFGFMQLENGSSLRLIRGDDTGNWDMGFQVTEFLFGTASTTFIKEVDDLVNMTDSVVTQLNATSNDFNVTISNATNFVNVTEAKILNTTKVLGTGVSGGATSACSAGIGTSFLRACYTFDTADISNDTATNSGTLGTLADAEYFSDSIKSPFVINATGKIAQAVLQNGTNDDGTPFAPGRTQGEIRLVNSSNISEFNFIHTQTGSNLTSINFWIFGDVDGAAEYPMITSMSQNAGEDSGMNFHTRGPDMCLNLGVNGSFVVNNSCVAGGPIPADDGEWHMVTLLMDKGNTTSFAKIYVDGSAIGTINGNTFPTDIEDSFRELKIGGTEFASSRVETTWFVDDFAIWNGYQLTDSDVETLFNVTSGDVALVTVTEAKILNTTKVLSDTDTTSGSGGSLNGINNSTAPNLGSLGSSADAEYFEPFDNATSRTFIVNASGSINESVFQQGNADGTTTAEIRFGNDTTRSQWDFLHKQNTGFNVTSINLWVNGDVIGGAEYPILDTLFPDFNQVGSDADGFVFRTQNGAGTSFSIVNDGVTSTSRNQGTIPADDGNWHMMTVVIDKGNVSSTDWTDIYIDGVFESSAGSNALTFGTTVGVANTTLSAGSRSNSQGMILVENKFDIDDVTIWQDYGLNQTDVDSLFNSGNGSSAGTSGSAIQTSKQVGHWNFDLTGGVGNNTGVIVTDSVSTLLTAPQSIILNGTENNANVTDAHILDTIKVLNDTDEASVGQYNFTLINDASGDHTVAEDLGSNASNSAWVIRFPLTDLATVNVTVNSIKACVGLTNQNHTISVSEAIGDESDSIGIQIDWNSNEFRLFTVWVNENRMCPANGEFFPSAPADMGLDDRYIEIIRNSTTLVTWNIYNDTAYTQKWLTHNQTIDATVDDMNFLKMGAETVVNDPPGQLNFTIAEISFWNNTLTATGPPDFFDSFDTTPWNQTGTGQVTFSNGTISTTNVGVTVTDSVVTFLNATGALNVTISNATNNVNVTDAHILNTTKALFDTEVFDLSNLEAYWKFEETSGNMTVELFSNIVDANSKSDLGITKNAAGIIGNGWRSGESGFTDIRIAGTPSDWDFIQVNDTSYNFWVTQGGLTELGTVWQTRNPSGSQGGDTLSFVYEFNSIELSVVDATTQFVFETVGGQLDKTCQEDASNNAGCTAFTMYTITKNLTSTEVKWYVNGTLAQTDTGAGSTASPNMFSTPTFFSRTTTGFNLNNVTMDETSFWSRVLSPTEITNLYNNGSGFELTSNLGGVNGSAILVSDAKILNTTKVLSDINTTPSGGGGTITNSGSPSEDSIPYIQTWDGDYDIRTTLSGVSNSSAYIGVRSPGNFDSLNITSISAIPANPGSAIPDSAGHFMTGVILSNVTASNNFEDVVIEGVSTNSIDLGLLGDPANAFQIFFFDPPITITNDTGEIFLGFNYSSNGVTAPSLATSGSYSTLQSGTCTFVEHGIGNSWSTDCSGLPITNIQMEVMDQLDSPLPNFTISGGDLVTDKLLVYHTFDTAQEVSTDGTNFNASGNAGSYGNRATAVTSMDGGIIQSGVNTFNPKLGDGNIDVDNTSDVEVLLSSLENYNANSPDQDWRFMTNTKVEDWGMSFWLRCDDCGTIGDDGSIFNMLADGEDFGIRIVLNGTNDTIEVDMANDGGLFVSGLSSGVSLGVDSWTHVGLTFEKDELDVGDADNGTVILYINGTQVANQTGVSFADGNGKPNNVPAIGERVSSQTKWVTRTAEDFSFGMDDLCIWGPTFGGGGGYLPTAANMTFIYNGGAGNTCIAGTAGGTNEGGVFTTDSVSTSLSTNSTITLNGTENFVNVTDAHILNTTKVLSDTDTTGGVGGFNLTSLMAYYHLDDVHDAPDDCTNELFTELGDTANCFTVVQLQNVTGLFGNAINFTTGIMVMDTNSSNGGFCPNNSCVWDFNIGDNVGTVTYNWWAKMKDSDASALVFFDTQLPSVNDEDGISVIFDHSFGNNTITYEFQEGGSITLDVESDQGFTVFDNNFHMYTIVHERGSGADRNVTFFVDGVLHSQHSSVFLSCPDRGIDTANFCFNDTAPDFKASGTNGIVILDELSFWNRNVTSTELLTLYNGGAGLLLSNVTTIKGVGTVTASGSSTTEYQLVVGSANHIPDEAGGTNLLTELGDDDVVIANFINLTSTKITRLTLGDSGPSGNGTTLATMQGFIWSNATVGSSKLADLVVEASTDILDLGDFIIPQVPQFREGFDSRNSFYPVSLNFTTPVALTGEYLVGFLYKDMDTNMTSMQIRHNILGISPDFLPLGLQAACIGNGTTFTDVLSTSCVNGIGNPIPNYLFSIAAEKTVSNLSVDTPIAPTKLKGYWTFDDNAVDDQLALNAGTLAHEGDAVMINFNTIANATLNRNSTGLIGAAYNHTNCPSPGGPPLFGNCVFNGTLSDVGDFLQVGLFTNDHQKNWNFLNHPPSSVNKSSTSFWVRMPSDQAFPSGADIPFISSDTAPSQGDGTGFQYGLGTGSDTEFFVQIFNNDTSLVDFAFDGVDLGLPDEFTFPGSNSGGPFWDGEWHHIVYLVDRGNTTHPVRICVDGTSPVTIQSGCRAVAIDTAPPFGELDPDNTLMFAGIWEAGQVSDQITNFEMDEIAIWEDYILTDSEIDQIASMAVEVAGGNVTGSGNTGVIVTDSVATLLATNSTTILNGTENFVNVTDAKILNTTKVLNDINTSGGTGFDLSDLEIYYKMDGTSMFNELVSNLGSQGRGNQVSVIGTPTFQVAGIINNGIEADASGDGVLTGNFTGTDLNFLLDTNGRSSVNFWLFHDFDGGDRQYIFSTTDSVTDNGCTMDFNGVINGMQLECFPNAAGSGVMIGGLSATNSWVLDNDWHMWTVTMNHTSGGLQKFYLDGVQIGDQGGTTWTPKVFDTNPNDISMFQRKNAPIDRSTEMPMDEFSLWSKILSPTEISTLYNNGTGLELGARTYPDPVLYLDFEDQNLNAELITNLGTYGSSADCVVKHEVSGNMSATDIRNSTGLLGNSLIINGTLFPAANTGTKFACGLEDDSNKDTLWRFLHTNDKTSPSNLGSNLTSINLWVLGDFNKGDALDRKHIVDTSLALSGSNGIEFQARDPDRLVAHIQEGTGANIFNVGVGTTAIPDDGQFHMITLLLNKTEPNGNFPMRLCLDATSCVDIPYLGGQTFDGSSTVTDRKLTVGSNEFSSAVTNLDFNIDELAVWKDHYLTATELAFLYNGGVGNTVLLSNVTGGNEGGVLVTDSVLTVVSSGLNQTISNATNFVNVTDAHILDTIKVLNDTDTIGGGGGGGNVTVFSNEGTLGTAADAEYFIGGVGSQNFVLNATAVLNGGVFQSGLATQAEQGEIRFGNVTNKSQWEFLQHANTGSNITSINLWINGDLVGSPHYPIFSTHTTSNPVDGFSFDQGDGTNTFLRIAENNVDHVKSWTSGIPDDGQWHMVTVIYDKGLAPSTWTQYIDGVVSSQSFAAGGVFTGSGGSLGQTLTLGGDESFSGNSVTENGYTVDDLSIWNGYTLTATNVTNLYNSGVGSEGSGIASGSLVLYHSFDAGGNTTGVIVTDSVNAFISSVNHTQTIDNNVNVTDTVELAATFNNTVGTVDNNVNVTDSVTIINSKNATVPSGTNTGIISDSIVLNFTKFLAVESAISDNVTLNNVTIPPPAPPPSGGGSSGGGGVPEDRSEPLSASLTGLTVTLSQPEHTLSSEIIVNPLFTGVSELGTVILSWDQQEPIQVTGIKVQPGFEEFVQFGQESRGTIEFAGEKANPEDTFSTGVLVYEVSLPPLSLGVTPDTNPFGSAVEFFSFLQLVFTNQYTIPVTIEAIHNNKPFEFNTELTINHIQEVRWVVIALTIAGGAFLAVWGKRYFSATTPTKTGSFRKSLDKARRATVDKQKPGSFRRELERQRRADKKKLRRK